MMNGILRLLLLLRERETRTRKAAKAIREKAMATKETKGQAGGKGTERTLVPLSAIRERTKDLTPIGWGNGACALTSSWEAVNLATSVDLTTRNLNLTRKDNIIWICIRRYHLALHRGQRRVQSPLAERAKATFVSFGKRATVDMVTLVDTAIQIRRQQHLKVLVGEKPWCR
jgi:hypothetical protein